MYNAEAKQTDKTCSLVNERWIFYFTVDSLLTDTSVKRTHRGVGPCLSLLPLFESL